MNNAEEKNTSHMIFYGEKDIDYTKSSNYAFLNWNFDNSLGGKDNVSQLIQDNFVMGNAYMGNAVLSLYSILCSGNYCSTADVLIFPIMFDLWHGVELWLKSSVAAIYYILGMDNEVKKNHKIYEYLEVLEKELKKLDDEKNVMNAEQKKIYEKIKLTYKEEEQKKVAEKSNLLLLFLRISGKIVKLIILNSIFHCRRCKYHG